MMDRLTPKETAVVLASLMNDVERAEEIQDAYEDEAISEVLEDMDEPLTREELSEYIEQREKIIEKIAGKGREELYELEEEFANVS